MSDSVETRRVGLVDVGEACTNGEDVEAADGRTNGGRECAVSKVLLGDSLLAMRRPMTGSIAAVFSVETRRGLVTVGEACANGDDRRAIDFDKEATMAANKSAKRLGPVVAQTKAAAAGTPKAKALAYHPSAKNPMAARRKGTESDWMVNAIVPPGSSGGSLRNSEVAPCNEHVVHRL